MPFFLLVPVALANVFGVGMLVPQALRLARRRCVSGVSPTWIGVGVAINAGWLIYAAQREVYGLIPVSLGSLVLYLVMANAMYRIDQATFTRAVIAALVVSNVLAWSMAVDGVGTLGLALAGLYTVQFAPASVSAVRTSDLDGVAPSTWVMAFVEAVIWAGYGAAISDVAVLLGGAGASVMSAVVLVRLAGGWPSGSAGAATRRSLPHQAVPSASFPVL